MKVNAPTFTDFLCKLLIEANTKKVEQAMNDAAMQCDEGQGVRLALIFDTKNTF